MCLKAYHAQRAQEDAQARKRYAREVLGERFICPTDRVFWEHFTLTSHQMHLLLNVRFPNLSSIQLCADNGLVLLPLLMNSRDTWVGVNIDAKRYLPLRHFMAAPTPEERRVVSEVCNCILTVVPISCEVNLILHIK